MNSYVSNRVLTCNCPRIAVLVILAVGLAASVGDVLGSCSQVIYDNTTDEDVWFHPGVGYELLDFGTSDEGRVCKFIFGYVTTLPDPGTVTIRFYSGTNYATCPGTFLKSFTFTGLPGSPNGSAYPFTHEVELDAENQFDLPNGPFGYSFEFDNSNAGTRVAYGGKDNKNFFWENCVSIYFGGEPWAGFYMKIYTWSKSLISGYVLTAEGMGVKGVLVSADNDGGSDTTDSEGYYELLVPDGWSGTVTPSRNDWKFNPASRSYNNVTEDQPNKNYTIVLNKVTTATYQVSASADDAYAWTQDSQDWDSSYLLVGFDYIAPMYFAPYYMAGMRFTDVQIPNGVFITEARLKMRNSIWVPIPGWPLYGVIQAETADNPGDFTSVKVGQRSKTNAAVNWDHMQTGAAEWWYTSPDIAKVVQKVIDRPGWTAGNAMVIFYSNRRNEGFNWHFWSYDQSAGNAPKLEITYAEAVALLGDFEPDWDVDIDDLTVFVKQWLLEKLSKDVAPDGGDGIVNFLDWAVFADGWQNTTDINDLAVFVDQWLQHGAWCADIAPYEGDGAVNMFDFAVFANNWRAVVE